MMIEMPTARNVPIGRLLPGSFKSPDMLTPWVNPVTAGKKMAKRIQKFISEVGLLQLLYRRALFHFKIPPAKKETKAANKSTMTIN